MTSLRWIFILMKQLKVPNQSPLVDKCIWINTVISRGRKRSSFHKIDHSYLSLFPDTSAASARLSDNIYSLCSTNVFPIPFCSENIVLRYCRSALSIASNFYLFLLSVDKCLLTGFVYSSQKWAPASTSTKTSTNTKKTWKLSPHQW